MYHTPDGTFPSITNLLYEMISKKGIEEWKAKVGKEQAQKISTKASRRGTRIHGYIEKYMAGNENYLDKAPPDHMELVNLVIPQINEKIDNYFKDIKKQNREFLKVDVVEGEVVLDMESKQIDNLK